MLQEFVGIKELSSALGLSRSGLYQLSRRGDMPKPCKIGHSLRWAVQDIYKWLETKKIAADSTAGDYTKH